MNIIDELTAAFQKTFDDQHLSKSERKALQQRIGEAGLDRRKRDILRAKVFDIARAGLKSGDSYFVIEWLEDASRLLMDRTEDRPESSVYFSPGEACLDAIVSRIQGARHQLDICVFTISDNRISDTLVQRHRRGLDIRIITDNEKLHDTGSDVRKLSDAGIAVRVDRTPYHMHHKYAVIDGGAVITGSYNWTRSAAEYNEENIVITAERGVVDRYREAFRDLWGKTEAL